MYKHRLYKVNKGYMAIYVMLAGLLLLSISLVMFKFEVERRKTISYRRKAIENKDENDYRKEKILSDLYEIIKENGIDQDKASVIQYLKTNSSDINLDFDGMRLRFLPEKEQLLLVYNYNAYYNRVEYYDLDLSEGALVVNLLSSDLVGRYDYVY